MRRWLYVTAGALILAVALPNAASASAVDLRDTTLVYDDVNSEGVDEGAAAKVTVARDGAAYTFVDLTSEIVVVDPVACEEPTDGGHRVRCSATGVDGVAIFTDNGDDEVDVDVPIDNLTCGGDGDDTLRGGAGRNMLIGGRGHDTLSGGPDVDDLIAELDGEAPTAPTGSTAAVDPDLCFGPIGDGSGVGDILDGGDGGDFVFGGPGPDTLRGGAGEDILVGFGGNDTISGAADIDLLLGMGGNDALIAGGGGDILQGSAGDDVLHGEDGDDDLGATVVIKINGATVWNEESGDDLLDGGDGDDGLAGGPVGPLGGWVVGYQSGQVTPVVPVTGATNGADRLRGGPGYDQLTYAKRSSSVELTLDARANDGGAAEGDDVASDIEMVTGGLGADRIAGDAGDNVVDGGAGPDVILGGGGGDTLNGGALDEASDRLDGGAGPDKLFGGPGDDVLSGSDGADTLSGEGGNDDLDGGADGDALAGGPGADTLRGSPGGDTLDGEDGRDLADYGASARPVRVALDARRNDGEDGADLVRAIERVRGGRADDELEGDGSANELDGGPGDDFLDGRGGADFLHGGDGFDAIRSRGGGRDAVGCGAGIDLAVVDTRDQIDTSSGERCERVDAGHMRRPKARRTAMIVPLACRLRVRFPGTKHAYPVEDRMSVALGTRVVAHGCRVRIRLAGRRRGGHRSPSTATLAAGAVAIRQPRSGSLRSELVLVGARSAGCGRGSAATIRRVALAVNGTFRMRPRFGDIAATRASLIIEDRCRATLVRVRRGVVRVRDPGSERWVRVERGRGHVARPATG